MRHALLSLILAAVLAPADASAATLYPVSAGSACRPTSGGSAHALGFSDFDMQNHSDELQYVTCGFGGMGVTADFAFVDVKNMGWPRTTATITCVLVAGHEGGVVNASVARLAVAPYGEPSYEYVRMHFDAMPARATPDAPYSLNCALPGGFRVGMIALGTNA